MNIDNYMDIRFMKNPLIIGVVSILLLIFVIDLIQLIISHLKFKLSKEEEEQLKEISRLRRKIKFNKPPKL
jgi:uncharacterized membrane protein